MKKQGLIKKMIAVAAGLTLIMAAATGCGGAPSGGAASSSAAGSASAAGNEGTTFKYIVNNVGDVTTFDIAIKKGFFKDEGVNVEDIGVAGGGAAVIQTLDGKGADIGNEALPAYINAVSNGTGIKVVYGGPAIGHAGDPGYQILVRKDSDIKSAEDLKGKTIAVAARGAMFEYVVRLYLEKAKLTVDVNLIVVPSTQHEQVLDSKQADACVDGSPIADKMIENGTAKNLSDVYHVLGEELAGNGWGMILRTEVIENNPEDVKKLVSALIKADEWTEQNPEEARKLVKEILVDRGQSEELAKYWHPIKLVNHGLWTKESVQFWIDYGVKVGNVKEGAVTPEQVFTNEFNPFNKG